MNQLETFHLRCHEATEFCLAHAGKCFGGWTREKIFLHIGSNALAGTLFIVKYKGKVNALGIAKPTGDGRLFVGEVIGTRAACRQMFARVLAKWPGVKRVFAYRHKGKPDPRLVEYPLAAVLRMTGFERSAT